MSTNTKLADPGLALWQAMNEAEKVGNRTDDKLIVKFLREAGYCIAAIAAHDAEQAQSSAEDQAAHDNAILEKGIQVGRTRERQLWEHRTEQAAQAVPAVPAEPLLYTKADLDAAVTAEREACASAAWIHYMDACKARKLAPSEHERWNAARAVRAVRGPIVEAAQAVPALCANCAPSGRCEKRQALCEPGMAARAAQAVPAYTEGHCKEKAKPGGCQLHNLHCGYPACDRKTAPAAPAPEAQRSDGMPASADERHLRRLLAARVGMPQTYFDDGEAQGVEHGISIDFMREPVAHLDAKLRALNVARYEVAKAAPAPEAPTLTHELQQQCSDWGVYWRASDAHGVDLSIEQAEELLRRALGVEVAISMPAPQAQAAGQEQDERAAFEAWAKENRHGRISGEDEWDMDYPLGRCLWRAWQARAARAQRQPLTEQQKENLIAAHFPNQRKEVLALIGAVEKFYGIGGATTGEQQ